MSRKYTQSDQRVSTQGLPSGGRLLRRRKRRATRWTGPRSDAGHSSPPDSWIRWRPRVRPAGLVAALVLCAFVTVRCGGSPTQPTPTTPRPPQLLLKAMTFVAFGDSVTEGENALPLGGASLLFIDTANAYPTKLQSKLATSFPGQSAVVINEGVSNETSEDGVDRLPGVLAQHQPDGLLLLEGYNDLGTGDPDPDAIQQVVASLQDMVQDARDAGVPYVFVSTLTPGRTGLRQRDASELLQVNALIRLMVMSEGAILVDSFNTFVGREATLVSDDGLHLTAAGNDVLAETFLSSITSAVTSGGVVKLRAWLAQ